MNILNPVLLTAQATQKLPKALLLCMLLAYAVSGLIGRDPWRGDDAVGFGMALAAANGEVWTQLQSVAGAGVAFEGPLWFWVVGLFIAALPFLPAHAAAYVPVGLSIMLAAYALWYAVYYLAKTPAAQPLALALGGQPKPIDYAKAVADGAVLLLLATLGIALRLHEINAQSAQFALLCAAMLGVGLSLYKPRVAGAVLCAAVFALGAGNGFWGVLPALAWLGALACLPAWRSVRTALPLIALCAAFGVAAPFGIAHALGQGAYSEALWAWNVSSVGLIPATRLRWLLSNAAFIAWPALPFAVAALWRWRRFWREPHVWAGASYLVVYGVSMLFRASVNDAVVLALLPGALVLAAFLLPALPRVWMNAIDWFGVMALSTAALLVWLVWTAMTLGWPSAFTKSVLRLVPGFDTSLQWPALLAALCASVFWIAVVRWRVLSVKTVVWRAAVVWSAGSLTVWVLLGSLFMPFANHIKTYRGVASELKAALKDHSQCVSPLHLGLPQRALLAHFGDIRFERQPLQIALDKQAENAPIDTPATVGCDWLLDYTPNVSRGAAPSATYLPQGNWQLRWEGRRYRDKDERLRLYQRAP